MFSIPERPSFLRKLLLAPPALAYATGASLQRTAWRTGSFLQKIILKARAPHLPSLPLIVIGSLRAGGAGKTAVTLELARHLAARGKRVGILAYRIHAPVARRKGTPPRVGELEVWPHSKWEDSSDEAVLLARALEKKARIFVTRNRAMTWRRLEKSGSFDVLLSDDGLMDARLEGKSAFRVALVRAGEKPGLLDLLPAGPYRLTASTLKHMDFVLEFSRETVLPNIFDFSKRYWILSGMGNPAAFRTSLEKAGVQVAGISAGSNHGLPNLEKARQEAQRAGSAGFLYTKKDGIKLKGLLRAEEGAIEVGENITLSPHFLSALDVFLTPASS